MWVTFVLLFVGLIRPSQSPSVASPTRPTDARSCEEQGTPECQYGARPYYLVDNMDEGPLKTTLKSCQDLPVKKSRLVIGHRGAALTFPEHTYESYEAAARLGAGIIECDVTFTQDLALVCRHSQCDLHTSTDILMTDLASKCSQPFTPATYNSSGGMVSPASALCCTTDITVDEFRTLVGKMDGADDSATTVWDYVNAVDDTHLFASRGRVMTHNDSIELFKELGVNMIPELKQPMVPMPYNGFTLTAVTFRIS